MVLEREGGDGERKRKGERESGYGTLMSMLAVVKAFFPPDLIHVFLWQEVAAKWTSMSVSPAPATPKAHSGATISSTDTSACASLDTQVSAAR